MPSDEEINDLEAETDLPAKEVEGELKDKEVDTYVTAGNITEPVQKEAEGTSIDSSGKKVEDGEGIVKNVMKKLGIGGKDSKTEEEGEDIPDTFTNACLKMGWEPDEIAEFASGLDDKTLVAMIPDILDMGEADTTTKKDSDKPENEKIDSSTKEKSELKSDSKELAAVKKELAEIKEALGQKDEKEARQSEAELVQTVNQSFDEAAEEFKIFGKTDELLKYPAGPNKGKIVPTSPEMVARSEVWDKAIPYINMGVATKDAMEIALTWYKGANLEKDVHRKVLTDLKRHESKLSAKRTGKRTVKTYEDEDERKADVVRKAARDAGVKGDYGL